MAQPPSAHALKARGTHAAPGPGGTPQSRPEQRSRLAQPAGPRGSRAHVSLQSITCPCWTRSRQPGVEEGGPGARHPEPQCWPHESAVRPEQVGSPPGRRGWVGSLGRVEGWAREGPARPRSPAAADALASPSHWVWSSLCPGRPVTRILLLYML